MATSIAAIAAPAIGLVGFFGLIATPVWFLLNMHKQPRTVLTGAL